MLEWLGTLWRRYTNWCDEVGLNPEEGRCCMPALPQDRQPSSGSGMPGEKPESS